MFETRHNLARRTMRLSAVADSADTTINVNTGGGRVPPRPEFQTYTRSTTTTPDTPDMPARAPTSGTVVESHKQINWGGVVKGAAIIAGIALVGVVAFYAAPAILTSLGVIGPGGLLTGVVEAATPMVTEIGAVALDAVHFMDDFIGTLVSNAFNAVGGGSLVSGVTGAVSNASAATVTAVHNMTGALAAGGAVAAGIPLAVKSMMSTPLTETVHTAHAVTPTLGTGHEHSTTPASDHHSTQNGIFADLPEIPDESLVSSHSNNAAAMKTASKVAHHAAHSVEEQGHAAATEQRNAGEHRTRDALRTTARTSEAWAERVGGARTKQTITPRASEFAEQIAEDRSKLDQALSH